MSQHFLLSAKSRTISELEVARMSENEARKVFEKLRWSDTNGKPVCSNCGCTDSYVINTHTPLGKPIRRYKCSACRKQYTVTSGTIFASHKLELRDYLLATIIFVNAVKGISASQMSRALGCQYISPLYLSNYANEIAYREDNRRLSNKSLMLDIAEKCMLTPTHNEWCGYWQGNKRVAERLVA